MRARLPGWQKVLRYDPLGFIAEYENLALDHLVKRDILGLEEKAGPDRLKELSSTPEVARFQRLQRPNGSWKYPGRQATSRESEDYDLLETYSVLRELIEMCALDRRVDVVEKACYFILTKQTSDGDIRGIYGNQYSPNYTGGMLELVIKAGFEDDRRIIKGLEWLLSVRQDDGGWAIPIRTRKRKYNEVVKAETLETDKTMPFSHLATGCVLRAFAAHPRYKSCEEALAAGRLLADRFFRPDKYTDRHGPEYWLRFTFPFWFTDLLSGLDSLSRMGFRPTDLGVKDAVEWFVKKQRPDGGWRLRMVRGGGDRHLERWTTMAIARALRRLYD